MESRSPESPRPYRDLVPVEGRRGRDGERPGAVAPFDGGLVARVVGQLATTLLVAAAALAAQPPLHFTLGDGRERVRQVQGAPDVIERLPSLQAEHWSYGTSTVTFDPRTGRVVAWVDGARRLHVRLSAPTRPATTPLALGDHRDDVVRRFGTPWAYTRDAAGGHAFLAYGRSVVRVDAADGRVTGWIVRDSALRVADDDRTAGERAMGIVRDRSSGGASGGSGEPTVAPPSLRGTVSWREASGDGVLAPGESAAVTLHLTNDGPGSSRGIRPSLVVESPTRGVSIVRGAEPVTLAPGAGASVRWTLRADSSQDATEIVAVVRAPDADGFDLAPALRLRFPARPAGAPHLILRTQRLDDPSGDGRLAPREVGDLTLVIANTGSASTPSLAARLERGTDLRLAGGAPDTFALGRLAPGDSATITLALFTNDRAADTRLTVTLGDARGRLLARLPVVLPLTGRPSGVLDVAVARDSGIASGRRWTTDIESRAPRAARRRADAIAVILGIERYRALPTARFAERDAALMRRYAVETLGVNDDVEHLYLRTGSDVTGGELRKLFGERGWLARRVTENTDLLVYFAGHGAPDATRRAPYLLPVDADPAYLAETGLALSELFDRLARLPARSITVILDACFSGVARDGSALIPGVRPTVLSVEHPALVRRQMGVLSAARGAQGAGDLPEARHGLLTYWVARGLRGEADDNGDSAISFGELGRFAEMRVRATAARLDREQQPLAIARDTGFVVTRLAREER